MDETANTSATVHEGLLGELKHLGGEVLADLRSSGTFLTTIIKCGPIQEIARGVEPPPPPPPPLP